MPWPTRTKRQSPEAAFQATVIQYLRLRKVSFRAGMEGLRTKQWAQAKRMGLSAGWPDLMIHEPRGPWNGLALELKAGRNNVSDEQRAKIAYLKRCGWLCAALWPEDDWQGVIDFYLLGAPRSERLEFFLGEVQSERERE